jgi:hypothetical protein
MHMQANTSLVAALVPPAHTCACCRRLEPSAANAAPEPLTRVRGGFIQSDTAASPARGFQTALTGLSHRLSAWRGVRRRVSRTAVNMDRQAVAAGACKPDRSAAPAQSQPAGAAGHNNAFSSGRARRHGSGAASDVGRAADCDGSKA